MKIAVIRAKLLKQTFIVAAIIVGSVGGVSYLLDLSEQAEADIGRVKSEANSITSKANELSAQYAEVTGIMADYKEIESKQNANMLSVSKSALKDAVVEARKKYYVDGLSVNFGEIKPLSDAKYKRETIMTESGDVTMSFKAMSDVDVFGIIKQLHSSFSGIKFTSVQITAEKDLGRDAVSAISNSGFWATVNAKINFTIFGLQANAQSSGQESGGQAAGIPGAGVLHGGAGHAGR